MRNGVRGIVSTADTGRARVEDGIGAGGVEINQSIERWVPGAIRPDIVEDSVIVDSVPASDRHLSVAKRIPGESDARRVVLVVSRPHALYRIDSKAGNAGPMV